MTCYSCVHRRACEDSEYYDPAHAESCPLYISLSLAPIQLSYDKFELIVRDLLDAKRFVKRIKKSKNRDDAEFALDRAIDRLTGRAN